MPRITTSHPHPSVQGGEFDIIPDEIISEIVQWIHPKDDFRLACTCKWIRQCVEDGKRQRFTKYCADAHKGDENSLELVALSLDYGHGTTRDENGATGIYASLVVRGKTLRPTCVQRYLERREISANDLYSIAKKVLDLPLGSIPTACIYRLAVCLSQTPNAKYTKPGGYSWEALLDIAADRGHVSANLRLGRLHFGKNDTLSLQRYMSAARSGHWEGAYFVMAFHYQAEQDLHARRRILARLIRVLLDETTPRDHHVWETHAKTLVTYLLHGDSAPLWSEPETQTFLRLLMLHHTNCSDVTFVQMAAHFASGDGALRRDIAAAVWCYEHLKHHTSTTRAALARLYREQHNEQEYLNWLQAAALSKRNRSFEVLCEYGEMLRNSGGYSDVQPQHFEAVWQMALDSFPTRVSPVHLAMLLTQVRPFDDYEPAREGPCVRRIDTTVRQLKRLNKMPPLVPNETPPSRKRWEVALELLNRPLPPAEKERASVVVDGLINQFKVRKQAQAVEGRQLRKLAAEYLQDIEEYFEFREDLARKARRQRTKCHILKTISLLDNAAATTMLLEASFSIPEKDVLSASMKEQHRAEQSAGRRS